MLLDINHAAGLDGRCRFRAGISLDNRSGGPVKDGDGRTAGDAHITGAGTGDCLRGNHMFLCVILLLDIDVQPVRQRIQSACGQSKACSLNTILQILFESLRHFPAGDKLLKLRDVHKPVGYGRQSRFRLSFHHLSKRKTHGLCKLRLVNCLAAQSRCTQFLHVLTVHIRCRVIIQNAAHRIHECTGRLKCIADGLILDFLEDIQHRFLYSFLDCVFLEFLSRNGALNSVQYECDQFIFRAFCNLFSQRLKSSLVKFILPNRFVCIKQRILCRKNRLNIAVFVCISVNSVFGCLFNRLHCRIDIRPKGRLQNRRNRFFGQCLRHRLQNHHGFLCILLHESPQFGDIHLLDAIQPGLTGQHFAHKGTRNIPYEFGDCAGDLAAVLAEAHLVQK